MIALKLPGLDALRVHLAGGCEEFVEVRFDEHGASHWMATRPAPDDRYTLPAELPLAGLKRFFFAEREPIFTFDGRSFQPVMPPVKRRVFFGARACDLTGLAAQDRFFKDDPWYRARRACALVVGVDCDDACRGGFCHVVDAGPLVRAGTADVIVHRDHDAWVAAAVSEAGESALGGLAAPAADPAWPDRRGEHLRHVRDAFGTRPALKEGMRRIDAGEVAPALWEKMGVQCLQCSGCTSVCPTCSCFGPRDSGSGDEVMRERFWDSCLFEGFQREASGHNPARTAGARIHRYWFHKYSTRFAAEYGRIGCTGCGRCDRTCPGVIGAKSVLERIAGA